jgi:hypothetical protein
MSSAGWYTVMSGWNPSKNSSAVWVGLPAVSDAWFAMNRGEDALKDAVDLGVVFARENDEWFSCQLFQRDSQLPA